MDDILSFFSTYGFTGLVAGVLFIWNFRLQDQLKQVNDKVICIVEKNTTAMIELKETIRDFKNN